MSIIKQSENFRILDSEVLSICINNEFYPSFEDDKIVISITIKEIETNRLFTFQCDNVQEYSFSSSIKRGSYYIEHFSLMNSKGGSYYLSLDPYVERKVNYDEDNDWILFKAGHIRLL